MQEWINAGKDLLFPPSCRGCTKLLSATEEALCEECLRDVAFIESPKCTGCGRELSNSTSGDHLCGACLRRKTKLLFSKAVAITHYQEPVSTLLHSLKYGGDLSVLPALRAILASKTGVTLQEEDRVVPVPLHIKRLRYRGFNQAVLIARLFFPKNLNCILVDALQRVRHTDPQTDLDGAARRKNLRHAFAVSSKDTIRGRKIILVDDVYTTGTTVSECSRALLVAGAREVQVLTLARVRE